MSAYGGDIVTELLGERCADYPELLQVLITERDQFLCRSVYDVAMMPPRGSTVVAVVGIGHQQGIADNWATAEQIVFGGLKHRNYRARERSALPVGLPVSLANFQQITKETDFLLSILLQRHKR